MNAPELAQYLDTAQPTLLDVREPWEFDICQIEQSINIPMSQIPQRQNELDTDRETVVICHHGVRSLQVIQYLQQFDFIDLINLDGGVDAWARQIDRDMAVY
jgi:rhodanese-related sulfurtransferase